MTVLINVQTSDQLASNLDLGTSNQITDEILEIEREYGIELKKLHPDTTDPLLSRHFIIELEKEGNAEKIIGRLLQIPGIEGAYVKPPAQPP